MVRIRKFVVIFCVAKMSLKSLFGDETWLPWVTEASSVLIANLIFSIMAALSPTTEVTSCE